MQESNETSSESPEVQATPEQAGKGGVVPPKEHRWKPGQSGNPKGRKAPGAYILEEMAAFYWHQTPEDELRSIAKNKMLPPARRQAAIRMLQMLEHPDLADYEDLLHGQVTLKQLRDAGVATDAIKKFKPTKDGIEIELHNRSGEEFDRILNRTLGPAQPIELIERLAKLEEAAGIKPADPLSQTDDISETNP